MAARQETSLLGRACVEHGDDVARGRPAVVQEGVALRRRPVGRDLAVPRLLSRQEGAEALAYRLDPGCKPRVALDAVEPGGVFILPQRHERLGLVVS